MQIVVWGFLFFFCACVPNLKATQIQQCRVCRIMMRARKQVDEIWMLP